MRARVHAAHLRGLNELLRTESPSFKWKQSRVTLEEEERLLVHFDFVLLEGLGMVASIKNSRRVWMQRPPLSYERLNLRANTY